MFVQHAKLHIGAAVLASSLLQVSKRKEKAECSHFGTNKPAFLFQYSAQSFFGYTPNASVQPP